MTFIPGDFGFTDDHDLLRASARRLLAERSPLTAVRRLVDDELGYDRALYAELAELGWVGLALPEELGGAGLDTLGLALLFDETGRCLLPSPLLASALAALAIELAGDDERQAAWCPRIAGGELVASVALTEPGAAWGAGGVAAVAEVAGDELRLRGRKDHVMWGAAAGLIVAPFRLGEGGPVALLAVDPSGPGITVEPEVSIDSTRRMARVTFDGARVPRSALLEERAAETVDQLHWRGAALLAAEMTGGAEAVLGLTRTYATERVQFNRPIGSFQAVKHPIVNMMLDVELARSLALAAAAAIDNDPTECERPARMAKAFASDAFPAAAGVAIQLHGGFGFTWDCDAHFYLKRALWSRASFGDAVHHRRALAASLFDNDTGELADLGEVGLSMTL